MWDRLRIHGPSRFDYEAVPTIAPENVVSVLEGRAPTAKSVFRVFRCFRVMESSSNNNRSAPKIPPGRFGSSSFPGKPPRLVVKVSMSIAKTLQNWNVTQFATTAAEQHSG